MAKYKSTLSDGSKVEPTYPNISLKLKYTDNDNPSSVINKLIVALNADPEVDQALIKNILVAERKGKLQPPNMDFTQLIDYCKKLVRIQRDKNVLF